jgi:phosphoenolpyruvate-protein kinase (PTS system EI component)
MQSSSERYVIKAKPIVSGPEVSGVLVYYHYLPENYSHREEDTSDPSGTIQGEIERVEREIIAVEDELRSMSTMLRQEDFKDEAEILGTHLLIMQDDNLRNKLKGYIENQHISAEDALVRVFSEMKTRLLTSDNTATRERADDIEDILQKIRYRLTYQSDSDHFQNIRNVDSPIVVVPQLFVSHIIKLRENGAVAVITGKGTSYSHAAIIARAFGIPVMSITEPDHLQDSSGVRVVLRPNVGEIVIHPGVDDAIHAVQADTKTKKQAMQTLMKDSPLSLWLNILDTDQKPPFRPEILQGIGLFRSEFLLSKFGSVFPSEDEQVMYYQKLFRLWRDYKITIRTFDIGGDKSIPQLSPGQEDNPFLGLRAHRLYRFHPEIFITQIKAILRAGVECEDLRILYPMIETFEDYITLQKMVVHAARELEQKGTPINRNYKVGILIEVPLPYLGPGSNHWASRFSQCGDKRPLAVPFRCRPG